MDRYARNDRPQNVVNDNLYTAQMRAPQQHGGSVVANNSVQLYAHSYGSAVNL